MSTRLMMYIGRVKARKVNDTVSNVAVRLWLRFLFIRAWRISVKKRTG